MKYGIVESSIDTESKGTEKFFWNKKTFEGRWFFSDEEPDGNYTEKIPPDTAHEWNEELNKWVLRERKQLEET